MDWTVIAGLVRHVLTIIGGWFVSTGLMTEADAEVMIGAVLALAGVAWSVIDKRRKAQQT